MSKPSRFSDEQLIELLMDTKLKNNKQIAEALGVKSYGGLNNRLNQLRKNNALPKSSGRAKSIPKTEGCKLMPPADPVYRVPEPLPGTELLKFDDIKAGDKLLRNGKPIEVISAGKDLIIKDRFGYKGVIERKYFEDNPGKFTRDETQKITAGDIKVNGQPIKNLPDDVKRKIAEKLKDDAVQFEADREKEKIIKPVAEKVFTPKKPATVNPEFEDLFKSIDKALTEHTVEEQRQCVHFLKDCDHPLIDNCEDCTDYKDAMEIAEACEKAEPFNLDLDELSDPDQYIDEPTDCPKPRFEPIDYTDSDWFAIPAKGTVEYRIWMETMRKIQEINDARDVVREALEVGDRLPATEVDRYNKIVSRYQEEVGA